MPVSTNTGRYTSSQIIGTFIATDLWNCSFFLDVWHAWYYLLISTAYDIAQGSKMRGMYLMADLIGIFYRKSIQLYPYRHQVTWLKLRRDYTHEGLKCFYCRRQPQAYSLSLTHTHTHTHTHQSYLCESNATQLQPAPPRTYNLLAIMS
jgi:hypothetical protein